MPLVSVSPTRLATLSEAIDLVKKHKWEGLVLWRKDQATVVHVNGSPARCNCWKLKPVGEEDVVATGYELGKGKNAKVVGKFRIATYQPPSEPTGTDMLMRRADPQTRSWKDGHGGGGSFKPMGKCGTGLSDKLRTEALKWKYPCVIQIEYDQKSEKGFRFPVFIRKRDDKKVSDC
jgi:ATP-dependent DNA ligase